MTSRKPLVLVDGSLRELGTEQLDIIGLSGAPTAPTAAPSTSTDQIATTSFVQTAISGKVDKVTLAGNNDLNSMTDSGFYRTENLNPNMVHAYSPVIVSRGSDTAAQVSIHYGSGTMAVRGALIANNPSESTWTPWRTILADHNFNAFAPTLTGGGASGTWNINIDGTAANALGLSGFGLSSSPAGNTVVLRTSEGYVSGNNLYSGPQVLNLDAPKAPGLYEYDYGFTGTTPDGSLNYRTIEIGHGGRYSQIAMPHDADKMFFRRQIVSSWSTWREIWHSGNLVPSSGGEPGTVALLDAAGNVNAQGIRVRQTTGVGQGVQLYPSTDSGMPTFGISFAKQEYFGGHGTLNGDWATYLTMDNQAGRGWIFKNLGFGNVASIDNQGNATFNLDVRANRYNFATYHSSTDEGVNGTAGTVTGILTKRGDDYHRTTNAYSVKTFLSTVFLDKGTFASGTVAVVASDAEHQKITASGNITLTLAGFRATGKTDELLLECVNFGGKTIGFPTINWVKSDGSFTTAFASNGVTLQASGTDFILIWTHDGGTTLFGKVMR